MRKIRCSVASVKGYEHEDAFLGSLKSGGKTIVEIDKVALLQECGSDHQGMKTGRKSSPKLTCRMNALQAMRISYSKFPATRNSVLIITSVGRSFQETEALFCSPVLLLFRDAGPCRGVS